MGEVVANVDTVLEDVGAVHGEVKMVRLDVEAVREDLEAVRGEVEVVGVHFHDGLGLLHQEVKAVRWFPLLPSRHRSLKHRNLQLAARLDGA